MSKTTNVFIVVDQSQSMSDGGKSAKQTEMVWDMISQFAAEEREGHGTYNVSVFGVGGQVEVHTGRVARTFIKPEVAAMCAHKNTNTALYDGIGQAVSQAILSTAEAALVAIFSDGEENASKTFRWTLPTTVKQALDKGNITITFAGPRGAAHYLGNTGIPAGNFKAWDGSAAAMPEVVAETKAATSLYAESRRQGVTRSSTLYADASKLTTGGVRGMTKQVTPTEVREVSKHMDGRAIADFFKKFEPGRHYYQLVKPEYIQEDKDLIVHIKDKNEYRQGSRSVRILLNLPEDGKIRVAPGPHSDKFDIYVQSSSVNRKLVEKQKLLTL